MYLSICFRNYVSVHEIYVGILCVPQNLTTLDAQDQYPLFIPLNLARSGYHYVYSLNLAWLGNGSNLQARLLLGFSLFMEGR
jgi:hypothetical protein